ncbi:Ff.00g095110.m01.CDS01 [Fusarium sp. VM40]|nr:Ff.00g095110.m01.CDS01 [Fusarium sp. VM40]
MVPLFSPSVFGRFKDSHSRFTSSASSQKSPPSPMSPSQPPSEPMAILLIGPKQQRFKVNKRQLCAISPFFAERFGGPSSPKSISLWLPRESSSMFSLFVDWVHLGLRFRPHLDELMAGAYDAGLEASQNIHWSLIRLHLFASRLGLYRLQDLAMDAIQDLYLRCDWDVPSGLITFLYTECEDLAAIRLRRWAVAMVAFSFTGGPRLTFHPQESAVSEPTRFSDLLEELPEFAADYDIHMEKMRLSGLDIRFKNPQLRIPANRLRNDERAFGFRQCSFHSHRSSVGERRCPHESGSTRYRRVRPSTAKEQGPESTGLSAPTRRYRDVVPRPLFSGPSDSDIGEDDDDEISQAIKHVRSISSTLKV